MKRTTTVLLSLAASAMLSAQSGMSLNGQWLFKYAASPASADSIEATGFFKPDYSAASFDHIAVPSCWAILGYEEPVYREFGDAPHSEGFYIRHFRVPSSMGGQRVLLRFGGVWASAEVWLNGHRLGRHDSGYTSFAFDVSKYVKADSDNVLAVRVRQVYPGYETDTYDDWSLGGIFRDVTLESMPTKRWIDKVTVVTDFDKDYRDADLHVKTMVNDRHKPTLPGNYRSPGTPYYLHYLLADADGRPVIDTTVTVKAHTSTSRLVEQVFHVSSPRQWTAETPYLYRLTVDLLEGQGTAVDNANLGDGRQETGDSQMLQGISGDRRQETGDSQMLQGNLGDGRQETGDSQMLQGNLGDGRQETGGSQMPKDNRQANVSLQSPASSLQESNHKAQSSKLKAQSVSQLVGFREITTDGGVLRINGRAVKLRGVNRHDEWPTVGRATTREHWLRDITLMKEANINYIRACHYQHAKGFIELCDSLGMYVGEEVSLGGAGGLMVNPSFTAPMMLRVSETVERDLNDPCIVYWSVGNEDSFNEMYYEAARTVKALDPTRPVLYPWNADTTLPRDIDILAPHYWTAAQYDSICRYGDRPVITTEYVHAYGTQRFGGLEDCWRALHDNAHGAGGAVWMWADQGIVTPTEWTDNKYKSRSGGDRHLRISSAGWDGITDSWRNPTRDYWEVKNVYAPIYPKVSHEKAPLLLEGAGEAHIPIHNDYDFLSTKDITIKYKVFVDDRLRNEGETALDIAPHGNADMSIKTNIKKLKPGETAYVQLSFIKGGKEIARKSVELGRSDGAAAHKGKDWTFDDKTGMPVGMRPTIWHKLNEGDQTIRNRTFDGERYKLNVTRTDRKETADGYVVTTVADCAINDSNHFEGTYTFTVYRDGRMRVAYTITPTLTSTYLPVLGMAVKAAPAQWFGLGPDEAWPNKKSAEILGVWDARSLTGTRQARWVDTADGYRIVLDGDGYIDRDSTGSSEVRILGHVLGRAEKGRLNDVRYRLVPGKAYSGSFTIVRK